MRLSFDLQLVNGASGTGVCHKKTLDPNFQTSRERKILTETN